MEALTAADMDAPAQLTVSADITRDWLETAHANAGVNCSGCHQAPTDSGEPGLWTDTPEMAACASCHAMEVERFGKGKHGMRLAASLSPMTPVKARLPMHEVAAHDELTCNSCHSGHRFDTQTAAVDACVQCHADEHTLAYENSPHHQLWQAELAGDGKPGSGVSCATCHMPRVEMDVSDWLSRTVVDHNQSASLAPNSKMIRPACLHCHGLGFAINALADPALIQNNFRGQPQVHVESIDLARAEDERHRQGDGASTQ